MKLKESSFKGGKVTMLYKLEVNGRLEIVHESDLPRLVEEHMGRDTARAIEELIKIKEYNEYIANTDLVSYDMQLNYQNDVAMEIKDIVNELMDYLKDAKRINRDKIWKELYKINDKLNNIL